MDEQRRIPSFENAQDLEYYARARGLALVETSEWTFDFDAARAWLRRPLPRTIDCSVLHDAWFILDDVLLSVRGEGLRDEPAYNRVFKRLFWGLNLPVFTPPGQKWVPHWRHHEARKLRDTLREGLAVFRRHLRHTSLPEAGGADAGWRVQCFIDGWLPPADGPPGFAKPRLSGSSRLETD